MKETKDCKIIKDLFPSYIDGLTNEETNQYIEEHLNNCEKCKTVLEDMKKELELATMQKDSKEIEYIKKFNKKMKLLKTIILVILLIFLLSYARKMLIVLNLNNKLSEYANLTNYYVKSLNFTGAAEIMTVLENYKKEDKYIRRIKSLSETSKNNRTEYYNGEILNSYNEVEFMEKDEEYVSRKTAMLNDNNAIYAPEIPNAIDISHPLNFILMPLFSSITSEKCNGKDCYRIVLYSFGDSDGSIYYIEKETGLLLRSIGVSTMFADVDSERYDMITDYQYKFDVVTENDFIEPDINEYEIEE